MSTTAPEPAASRRELDLLREDVRRMDTDSTRGVGQLQVQLTDVVKEVAELKLEMNTRFDAHQKVHDQDHRDRVSGRRWLIGTAIAGMAAMAVVITMLFDILWHIHH